MKKILATLVLLTALQSYAQTVCPQQITGGPLYRGTTAVVLTTNQVIMQGDPLSITNVQVFADNVGAVTQSIASVGVEVGIGGDSVTSCWYRAYSTNAASGIFFCVVSNVPACNPVYWQVRFNTNGLHYTRQSLLTQPTL